MTEATTERREEMRAWLIQCSPSPDPVGRPSPRLDGGAPASLRMGERRLLLLLGPYRRRVCVRCWRS
jgi:hypothetical protein